MRSNRQMHSFGRWLLLGAALAFTALTAQAQTVLVPAGSIWRLLDSGTDQGTAWRAPTFNDTAWRSGAAELGYGDGDEVTLVGFGPNASAKYITTYFRHTFNVASPGAIGTLRLRLKRDDGAVVYLNGLEVHRSNMPAGVITYATLASSPAADDGTAWESVTIPATGLLTGVNVLAVEVHQSGGSSSDLSFDLELGAIAPGAPQVTRGPYLQQGTTNAMVIRWRTAAAVPSRVRYGTAPGNLTQFADELTAKTEHEIRLTGLSADTKYFYAIGTDTQTLAGDDAVHTFVTAPSAAKPTRIWVLGDAGSKTASQAAVRDAYLAHNHAAGRETGLWLMLGDNAYENGTDAEHQAAVFDMYWKTLRQSVLWPTIGNHDTAQSATPPASLPYFQMFTLPTGGEAGGLASGTEKYYSFDYGNIHFVCLDSMSSDRGVNGPMLTWLQNDLAANTKPWVIAFWHHPPYSKGSHDSDLVAEVEMTQMRQNALPILEQFGVDLVLTGHSHAYERSYLIDNHYGVSATFSAANKKNGGDGRPAGNGAYAKSSNTSAPHEGAVYVVAGSSGKLGGGALNHPAMFISLNNLGSLVLDVDGNRLDAKFLRETGAIPDTFAIVKGSTVNTPPSVTLITPGNGATAVAPATFNLAATAADSDGTIARVDFYRGSTLLGSSTTAPYQFNWTNVAAGSYVLSARALDNAGATSVSNNVNVTVTQPVTLPAAPSALTATAQSRTRINLAWTDNAMNETGFVLQRSTDGTTFATIATLGANVRTYANTGLTRNRTYTYRVRTYNSAGNSAFSNTASATTRR